MKTIVAVTRVCTEEQSNTRRRNMSVMLTSPRLILRQLHFRLGVPEACCAMELYLVPRIRGVARSPRLVIFKFVPDAIVPVIFRRLNDVDDRCRSSDRTLPKYTRWNTSKLLAALSTGVRRASSSYRNGLLIFRRVHFRPGNYKSFKISVDPSLRLFHFVTENFMLK